LVAGFCRSSARFASNHADAGYIDARLSPAGRLHA